MYTNVGFSTQLGFIKLKEKRKTDENKLEKRIKTLTWTRNKKVKLEKRWTKNDYKWPNKVKAGWCSAFFLDF